MAQFEKGNKASEGRRNAAGNASRIGEEEGNRREPMPSAHSPHMDDVAYDEACKGHSAALIAAGLGIHVRTFYRWIEDDGEHRIDSFAEQVAKGRAFARKQVEAAAFKGAVEGNPGLIQFYLRTQMPDEWGDRSKVEHSGDLNIRGMKDGDLLAAVTQRLAAHAGGDGPKGSDPSAEG